MDQQTTHRRRSAPERCRDPHPRRLETSATRGPGQARLRAGVRAISVGVALLVACSPARAADEAAERSQPAAPASSPAAPATADDARSSTTVLRCYAGACIATKAQEKPAQLKTAVRKTPWLGLSSSPVVSMGERKLGLRLLHGIYATVSLVPARPLLDPVPTDVSATDRVRVGVGCLLRF